MTANILPLWICNPAAVGTSLAGEGVDVADTVALGAALEGGAEQTLIRKFRETLLGMPDFRTSYGQTVDLFQAQPMPRGIWLSSQRLVEQAFGRPVSDFDEPCPDHARSLLEGGLSVYKESAYYMKRSGYGTNMMEVRPWGPPYGTSADRYGIFVVHVPSFLVEIPKGQHRLKSVNEYRRWMRIAAAAEAFETEPIQLLDVVVRKDVRQEIEGIFRREWVRIAEPFAETPPKFRALLDRVDPLFRFQSQPLFARREENGIVVAVHRPWSSSPGTTSVVATYFPDAFRFGDHQKPLASGLGGILHQHLGVELEVVEEVDGIVQSIKKDLE